VIAFALGTFKSKRENNIMQKTIHRASLLAAAVIATAAPALAHSGHEHAPGVVHAVLHSIAGLEPLIAAAAIAGLGYLFRGRLLAAFKRRP
jgi:hydrogenase/urease accessory protein HupE